MKLCVCDVVQGCGVESLVGEVGLDDGCGCPLFELLEFQQRMCVFTPTLQLYKDILGTHLFLIKLY